MKKIIITTIVIAGVSSAGYALYAKLQTDQKRQVEAALQADTRPADTSRADASYIANLLAQHSDALPLLQLVESRAKHQELKEFARSFTDIIQAEQQAISALDIEPSDTIAPKEDRLPRYVTLSEFKESTSNLGNLEGDEFDKQFIKYVRIQLLSDNLLGYKIIEQTSNQTLRLFADKAVKDRLNLSALQSEWPEQWGYAPPHDG